MLGCILGYSMICLRIILYSPGLGSHQDIKDIGELGLDSNSNSESLVLRITTNDSESEKEDYDLITSVADSDLII